MDEQNTDASVVEETQASDATEQVPATEDSSTSDENRIPHSRVKEMEKKAFEKGRQEALKKLLEEDEAPIEKEEESYQPDTSTEVKDERAEAMKVLREAIRKEVSPILVRQEVKEFLRSNPDAVDYVDSIKDLRKKSPGLSWDDAYKLASYDTKIKIAESKGVEQGSQGKESRESAKTEKPTATSKPTKGDIVSKIQNASIDEAEKILRNHLSGS